MTVASQSKSLLAFAILALLLNAATTVPVGAAPPQDKQDDGAGSSGSTIPLKLEHSIPLAVQSAGVEWRGGVYRLVELRSIRFELNQRTARLKAEIKAGVRTFDNVDYDVSVAVFDATGKLLGADRAVCSVPRIMHGRSTVLDRTINLDFGVSLDYSRAAAFMVGVSKRKVLTPDDWHK
jgi:hypothetical protein